MHALIYGLITWYLETLAQFGLGGVIVLMAMESSIFPVPSELVVPPAAYLEAYKKAQNPLHAVLLIILVILAGTVGSYIGATITYLLSRWLGRPFIMKYGKYLLLPPHKLRMAERWVAQYGAGGIFFARLLPVVRHVISIPAGVAGLRFRTFSIMTVAGSAVWCTVLTLFGMGMAKYMDAMIMNPNVEDPAYKHAFAILTYGTAALVLVSIALYVIVVRRKRNRSTADPAESMIEQ